ncbi:flagellar basal body-associated FliL family protein [Thermocrinis minervae]|uniref:Flagellar protein FliL n=1 Tax=Thermocrinis minervae TaxID=381751 RepID=A0A1M6PZV9_9AQUI|nr:flagellar basal body-associated protein FliL [Thermocrinis minervae]SHK13396.1 flagellar FliL protein [Thermocrinis minervae]
MAEEVEKKEEQKGGSKKRLIFLLVPLTLAIIAGGGAYLWFSTYQKKEKSEQTLPNQVGVMFDLGSFVVNLADKNADVYAKVSITLELSDEKTRLEVEKRLPIIKDAVIDVLSSKTSTFVKSPEGRESLRLELIRRINTILVEGGVRNVYFTEFVVQGI